MCGHKPRRLLSDPRWVSSRAGDADCPDDVIYRSASALLRDSLSISSSIDILPQKITAPKTKFFDKLMYKWFPSV
jgi:hypothetical protein